MAFPGCLAGLSGRALGLTLIFLTAIIWVAASFVSQLLVTHEEGRPNFNVPPFLLTYLSTSIFTVFLPLVQLKSLLQETWLLRRSFKYKPIDDDEEAAPMMLHSAAAARAAEAEADADADAVVVASAAGGGGRAGGAAAADAHGCQTGVGGGGGGALTADLEVAEAAAAADAASASVRASRAAHRESLTAAAQCFLLWFVAQFLFNQSLQLTSVTSNTILSSTSSLFTFALSMVFLREPYSAAKLLSIAACMGGTLLVTLSDDSSSGSSSSGPSHSVWGDMLCLVSAGFYACYTIVLRKALPDDDEANVALFFGYVGLLCSVVFAPVVALLGGIGALHLKAIPSKAYAIILVQGILNYCLSDYLWAHAVLLLGPTIATLGLSVQIPVAAVVEAIIGHPKWLSSGAAMAMTLSGTGLIMAGFVAGNMAGGDHVYGSHHRDDVAEQPDRCRSPGGPADDSFSGGDRRHTPSPGAPAAGGGRSAGGAAGGAGDGGGSSSSLPVSSSSAWLSPKQQQQQSGFGGGPTSSSMPVSTHAGLRSSNAGSCSSSPRHSSPGRPLSSSPQLLTHTVAAAAAAGGGSGGGQQPLQQQRVSQQWESIELSSSFGSEAGSRSEHSSSPSAVAALRPREQLPPPQRSPLGPPAGAGASLPQQHVAGGGASSLQAGGAEAAAVSAGPGQGASLLDSALQPQQ